MPKAKSPAKKMQTPKTKKSPKAAPAEKAVKKAKPVGTSNVEKTAKTVKPATAAKTGSAAKGSGRAAPKATSKAARKSAAKPSVKIAARTTKKVDPKAAAAPAPSTTKPAAGSARTPVPGAKPKASQVEKPRVFVAETPKSAEVARPVAKTANPAVSTRAAAKPATAPVSAPAPAPAPAAVSTAAPAKRRAVTPEPPRTFGAVRDEPLPASYGRDRVDLLVRDPNWVYAFWEVTPEKEARVKKEIGGPTFDKSRRELRLYDVTGMDFDGFNARHVISSEIRPSDSSWYVHVEPDREYVGEVGIVTPYGRFLPFAQSTRESTPPGKVSPIVDDDFTAPEPEFKTVYKMSVGAATPGAAAGAAKGGGASPIPPEETDAVFADEARLPEDSDRPDLRNFWSGGHPSAAAKRPLPPPTSGPLFAESSPGGAPSSAPFSPGKAFGARASIKGGEPFFLEVWTEFTLHGRTMPDAHLTVCDEKIDLRPDGTFTIHYPLPTSERHLPVQATSASKTFTLGIEPAVRRWIRRVKK